MKPRMCYARNLWWCRRMGVIGCGATMQEAWDDMWALYAQAIRQLAPNGPTQPVRA